MSFFTFTEVCAFRVMQMAEICVMANTCFKNNEMNDMTEENLLRKVKLDRQTTFFT